MATNPFRPPSSFQRRLESSGLYKPFPQSGNDSPISVNQPGKNRRHPNTSAPPPWIPRRLVPDAALPHGSAELTERPTSMQAWIPVFAGMTTGLTGASRPAPDMRARISPRPDNPGLKRLINRNHAAHIPVTLPGHGLAAQVQEQTRRQFKLGLGPQVKTAAEARLQPDPL